MSFFEYVRNEITRSYMLDHDQERYTSKREKMYTFMRIPRELEKFMSYGFFHCLDSFLFIYTFLPLRVSLAVISAMFRAPLIKLGYVQPYQGRMLFPAEIIDILKVLIILVCCYAMSYVDTSMLYHMIKSQSVIKLYLMYNMIEVADRLFSAFGQDTIDALFWTATEPKGKKREHIGVVAHLLLAVGYVFLHALLVLLQATTLNVAINSSNKALLTIMMSNNFVELKGSVFKKFDKNNLFQVSCSDVRERFHLFALLFVVVLQTMKEYGWKEESFWSLAPDCLIVLGAEVLVDWIKHAFITRFNEVSADVYKDYTISLAYDLAQTKQKLAFSDHSDIVSRRMGFIPLPLGVVMLRVIYTSVKSTNPGAVAVAVMAYICLFTFRVLGSIVILGKACDLIDEHKAKQEKKKISVDECRPQVPPKQTEDKKFSVEELNPAPVPLVHQRVETILHKTKEDQELFQLPDQSSERLFLFQNSCEDRSDVILTNMNSAMIDDDEDTNDNILDESETECTRLSDTSELDEENHKDSSNLTPESLLLSPAAKAKSLSSPDLLRREAEDWEDEEEESILVTAQGSMLSPQTFLPHLEPGVRKRDTPGT
ncbi:transmembrane anterior posterior transformation protein 1 homolog [Eurytemora carolleeae]|uniref:transmembrane anterior posterior transformation protein 1 homolog n=1 Tax=Eurytemora carolleeae TaxID=1294199 RepID=UPI000C792EC8|nr:transmembrane anterior posterior transformation protein 1 homolog [Eurytemora carolleeae]|eukprot:XP_023328133.1 transmembrane anterior posterior transformation protein 1 homolog [Eurytemora affinis]